MTRSRNTGRPTRAIAILYWPSSGARQNLSTPDDVLAYYRLLNSPAIQLAFIETDFRDALKLPGPDYYGQQYYAFNDLRNWRMVANIVEVSANDPGARVLTASGDADLVVMAWHGRMDGDRARTLRTLLEATRCPVMLVRAEP